MNHSSTHAQTLRLVQIALLTALMLLLQLAFGSLRIGPVTLSFSLVPLVIAAVFIGPGAGALLGLVSGVVTFVQVLTAADPFYTLLIATNPLLTALICISKTTLAGLLAGLCYRAICKVSKYRALNVILPAVVCPVVNTGIFCIGMYFGFGSALQSSEVFGAAASAGLVSFILIGLAGVNFLYEVLSNVVVCPIVAKALYSSKFFKDAK
ncbi:MAG: ECF transporter S component [Clostridiales bacterium]|nr:ECF transporter S component [Clostridiales bacterium]